MPVVGHFRAAKGARIQYNNTNLLMADWNANDQGDKLDSSCFENSAGQEQYVLGFSKLDYDASGNWNAQTNPFDNPPGIVPTDNGGPIKLFTNTAESFWNIPQAFVASCSNGAPVKQLVTYKFSGAAQPGWSPPTGSY